MAKRRTIDASDVLGMLQAPKSAPKPVPSDDDDWTPGAPRYLKCAVCYWQGPCMMSFCGDEDWSPYVPEHGTVRKIVGRLRKQTGKRTINICSRCVAELNDESDKSSQQVGQRELDL